MGTDISLWVEYKNANGEWMLDESHITDNICNTCEGRGTKPPIYDNMVIPCHCGVCWKCACDDCHGCGKIYKSLYVERNYALFTMLADERGCKGITPFSCSRGLPSNVSKDCKILVEYYGWPHSYLTLNRLKKFNWNKIVKDPESKLFGKTYAECADRFYQEIIPKLERLAKKHGSEQNVRIVFGFG